MFLVREGEAMVYRETEHGHRVKMMRMGEGEFFGEMTLIDIQKRSASVVVESRRCSTRWATVSSTSSTRKTCRAT